MESRVTKSFVNARINFVFYILLLFISFFSRKIFLESLGNEFIGLTSTLQNILGLFNLAELGVGSAIAFSLYKPLFKEDKKEITDLISVFGYMYRKIGVFIVALGLIVVLLIPLIFQKTELSFGIIYFTYFSFFASSLFTYFFNYKQTLLVADQREYLVTMYYQSANIVKMCFQIFLLLKLQNPYCWLLIELTFGIIYSIVLNKRVNKIYPWLRSRISCGKLNLKMYPEIIKHTKQIFVHKFASVVMLNTSSVFIYSFASLTTVTYYMNYNLIVQKVDALIAQILNSTSAGIGNLVAEGDKVRILRVFEELLAIRYLITGIVTVIIYYVVNEFIVLWLGDEYVLSSLTLGLILFSFFLKQTGEIVDQFLRAYGLFYDVWAPLTEAGINIVVSVVGGIYWGLNGILLGPVLGMIFIVHIWKPFFLFKKGFRLSVWKYWIAILKLVMVFSAVFIAVGCIVTSVYRLFPDKNFWNFSFAVFLIASIVGSSYIILMWVGIQGMRDFVNRLAILLKKKR